MQSPADAPSLRTQFHHPRIRRHPDTRLPRVGDERGIVADLAPPAGKALAPRPARVSRLPRLAPKRKNRSRGARTLLTMSVIFSWFGP